MLSEAFEDRGVGGLA